MLAHTTIILLSTFYLPPNQILKPKKLYEVPARIYWVILPIE